MKFTRQIIKDELERYKKQKQALKTDETYNKNESAREQFLSFYEEKIKTFEKQLASDKLQAQK